MAEESAVKVCIRVRPLIEREELTAKDGAEPVLYWKTDEKSVQQCVDDGNATKSFNFDRVFSSAETTAQLYNDIAKPLVASAVEGYNGTIFAYGQTASGKTFTMMGSDRTPGVIPLAMEDVFQTIKRYPNKEFLLRVSYMEIYNETVADLLVDNRKRKPLEVREGTNKTVYVAELTEELVTTPSQALAWIKQGEKNRHYEKTKMNQRSSRSHTIFRMILESRENGDSENADGAITVSHLNLVDLAGSERASQTGTEGARFKEGCNINKSLLILGQVIKKLSEENQRGFTNYRDSKLTRILQNSLGGNAKTVIICTITPATLDETLSTLQFASTAKYMKNDPHVTEVSDDGALLKRYRNEIVDLKRRLQQVSSVTQTTATEKESLFLMLQEKEQLRIEQTDKIRQLTRLIVTSTSFVASNKMPKRRVTWGGKLPSAGHISPSELSFAEPVTRKRRADMSTLSELGEYDEEFESRWEEPSYDPEINSTFGDSPQLFDKVSQLENQLKAETAQKEEALAKAETLRRRVEELDAQLVNEALQTQGAMEKMVAAEDTAAESDIQLKAELENQLKAETVQKEAAMAETLRRRVEELDTQLANEALLTQSTMEKMAAAENTALELDLQLKAETQQKLESVEKVQMLEMRVADLEGQVVEWTVTTSKADEVKKRDDETMQLFDSLVSNQEAVITERDHMKQEVEFLKEHAERLEQEKEELSRELTEKRDLDEFNSLEKDEHEQELKNEISSLKKALESAKCKCQEFEARLSTMSEDLKKQSDWAEELQSLNGKDLVQEVSKLRRTLNDAEGLSLDTKKEWAILRSQNITLKERDVEQTVSYEKMEAEVNGLRYQLETEKSRYKKMQVDLQKELNTAFDENTKLTTLLNGKVPKNLIDGVILEREVTNLKKELTVCNDKELELHAQLKELLPLQDLPDKVDGLLKQVCELTETLCAVESQRDSLLSGQVQSQEESHQLRDALQTSQDEIVKLQEELAAAEQKETHLTQRCADTTVDLDAVRSDLARLDSERSQLLATVQETSDGLNESEGQRATLCEKLNEMQQLIKDLEEKLVDSEQSKNMEEEIGKELQEQLSQLTEELESARAERDGVLSATQSSTAEVENLLSKVSSLEEQRDQLKVDLQENVDMVSQLSEELESARAERDCVLSEKVSAAQSSTEEVEDLLSKVSSLTEERDKLNVDMIQNQEIKTTLEENCRQKENIKQLEETLEERQSRIKVLEQELESVTEERNELKNDLMENVDMAIENQEDLRAAQEKIKKLENRICAENISHLEELQNQNQQLSEELGGVGAERDVLLSNASATEEVEKLLSTVTCLTEERDQLKEILEGLRQEKKQLRVDLEASMETTIENQVALRDADEKITILKEEVDLLRTQSEQQGSGSCPETVSHLEELQNQNRQLSEELDGVRAERDVLLSNASATEEVEKLLSTVTCLTEERDQLKEILEGLRQEKKQLGVDLEASMETTIENQVALRDAEEKITILKEEVDLLRTRSEQQGSGSCPETVSHLEELQNQNRQLSEELDGVRAERDVLLSNASATEEVEKLLSTVTCLTEERDQLKEILEGLRQEKKQLGVDLEASMETTIENQVALRDADEKITLLKEEVNLLRTRSEQQGSGSCPETVSHLEELQNQNQQLSEELDSVRAERDVLLSSASCTMSTVTCLTEERDQLKEILEGLRQEKKQLRADLEASMETTTEIREELGAAPEQIGHLKEEVNHLKTQIEQLEKGRVENISHLEDLQNQNQQLSKELDGVRAESDGHLSVASATMSTVTEERDQLREILEGLRQEKNQLKADLEVNMEMNQQLIEGLESVRDELQKELASAEERTRLLKQQVDGLNSDSKQLEELQNKIQQLSEELASVRVERDCLLSNANTSTGELDKLMSRVTHLTDERDQLQKELNAAHGRTSLLEQEVDGLNSDSKQLEEFQNKLQVLERDLKSVKEERNQLKIDLQETVDKTIQNQVELRNADEKVRLLKEEVNLLRTRSEKLQNQTIESQEELRASQNTVSRLKEEVDLVNAQSEQQENKSRAENVSHLEELQNQIEQLSEERDIAKIDKMLMSDELCDANETVAFLRDNLARSSVQMSSRLQGSVEQFEEGRSMLDTPALRGHFVHMLFADVALQSPSGCSSTDASTRLPYNELTQGRRAQTMKHDLNEFKVFMDACSSYPIQSLQEAKQAEVFLIHKLTSLDSLLKPTTEASTNLTRNVIATMHKKRAVLKSYARDFKLVFKDLVQMDLDLFEEKRLQDVLMCRAEATSFSVTEGNLQDLWHNRLSELLDKRNFYLQKIPIVLEKLNLWRVLTDKELAEELRDTESFNEQLRELSRNQPLRSASVAGTLRAGLQRHSAQLDNKKSALEAQRGELDALFEEVKVLRADSATQLRQERSNTATLLQTRESAPIRTECVLLKENQQLVMQLQQSEKQLDAMQGQIKQLEQAQVHATSTHKEVTQLLQTRLQDAYAEVQTLKDKLQSVETTTQEKQPPGVMEMKRLKAEVVKMELALTSQSTNYEDRIQSLNEALDQKATELRQLKIKMRAAQQEEECSFLQGKDLHYKLNKAKGVTVESSARLEKQKLADEVKQLESKITDLESQVLCQQKETAKWKGRAVMLKEKTKVANKPPSPCTPTKRLLPVAFGSSHLLNSPKRKLQDSPTKLGSPRKIPDSPKVTAPGKNYFDLDSATMTPRRSKIQFFDNSGLGATAAMAGDPISTDLDSQNLDSGAEKTEEWWPMSPKQSEVCKTQ